MTEYCAVYAIEVLDRRRARRRLRLGHRADHPAHEPVHARDRGVVQRALRQARAPLVVDQRRVEGRLRPFHAPLVDNQGRTRLAGGVLDDAAIASMNWLAAGVVGTLPGQ